MTTKTLKLTETEVDMLTRALGELRLGFEGNWSNSGYSKAEVKDFYRLSAKVQGTPPPDINEVWINEVW